MSTYREVTTYERNEHGQDVRVVTTYNSCGGICSVVRTVIAVAVICVLLDAMFGKR